MLVKKYKLQKIRINEDKFFANIADQRLKEKGVKLTHIDVWSKSQVL